MLHSVKIFYILDNVDIDYSISVGGGSDVGIIGCESLPGESDGGDRTPSISGTGGGCLGGSRNILGNLSCVVCGDTR